DAHRAGKRHARRDGRDVGPHGGAQREADRGALRARRGDRAELGHHPRGQDEVAAVAIEGDQVLGDAGAARAVAGLHRGERRRARHDVERQRRIVAGRVRAARGERETGARGGGGVVGSPEDDPGRVARSRRPQAAGRAAERPVARHQPFE
ncbi:MAG: hypothetical protein ACK55I_41190, partial [bacterium]